MLITYFKSKNYKFFFNIFVFFFFITFLGGIFWILTTNIGLNVRNDLLLTFPTLELIYNELVQSYTDYGIYTNVISRHFFISNIETINLFFGNNIVKYDTDVGYIRTIFSVGIFGLILQLIATFYSLIITQRTSKNNEYKIDKAIRNSLPLIVFSILIMEFKISVIFSTTVFEIFFLLFIILISKDSKNHHVKEYKYE
jgi:hypothetical protein